jgi:hypothetical protein
MTHFVVKIEIDEDIKAYQAGRVMAPMVSLEWLRACIANQTLLNPANYLYSSYTLVQMLFDLTVIEITGVLELRTQGRRPFEAEADFAHFERLARY